MPPRSRALSFPRTVVSPGPASHARLRDPASKPSVYLKEACRASLRYAVPSRPPVCVSPRSSARRWRMPPRMWPTRTKSPTCRASRSVHPPRPRPRWPRRPTRRFIEVPQSVSVVSREDLTLRNVQSLSDALNYTAGTASNATGTDQRYDWPYIRGFDAGILRRLPGRPEIAAGWPQSAYRALPDRIRRRAEGTEFGALRTEQPGRPHRRHEQDADHGVAARGGRPVGQLCAAPATHRSRRHAGRCRSRWRYRLTAIGFDDDTQIDHTYNRRVAIAPAITYAPDDDTSVTLLANYQRDLTNSLYPFLPAQGTVLFNPNGKLSPSLVHG
jgi:hypothetical protein